MNFIQCLHTVASEADSLSVLKRQKCVSTLRGSSYSDVITTADAGHSSTVRISPSFLLRLYLTCPAEWADVRSPCAWRRRQGRLPACHISSLFRQWILSTKKTSFHLWVSRCRGLKSKCGICKDEIRQFKASALPFIYQSGLEFVRCWKFLVLGVATSCSNSSPWNGQCQRV